MWPGVNVLEPRESLVVRGLQFEKRWVTVLCC